MKEFVVGRMDGEVGCSRLGVRGAFGFGRYCGVVDNCEDDLQPVFQPVVDRPEGLLKGGSFSPCLFRGVGCHWSIRGSIRLEKKTLLRLCARLPCQIRPE